MEVEQKFEYIKVPIQMIPLLYDGAIGISKVLTYCIYRAGMQFDISRRNVVRRLVYQYLNVLPEHRKIGIPKKLVEWLDNWDCQYEIRAWNEDYRGFDPNGQDYDPVDNEDDSVLDTILATLEDSHLWDLAEEYYRLGQVANLLNIKIHSTENVIAIHKKFANFDKSKVYAYAKFDKMMELWNRGKNLTEEDIEIYAGNLALKSIIGKKKVGRTERKLVLARMAGCVSSDDCTDLYLKKSPTVGKVHKKYSDKDNFRRLMGRLREGFVKYIETVPGKNRLGMFFSYSRDLSKYMFEEEVMSIVEKDKKEAAKIKKRMQRRKKKMGCRPAKGMDLKAHDVPQDMPF